MKSLSNLIILTIRDLLLFISGILIISYLMNGLNPVLLSLFIAVLFADIINHILEFANDDDLKLKYKILTKNLQRFQINFKANNKGLNKVHNQLDRMNNNMEEEELLGEIVDEE